MRTMGIRDEAGQLLKGSCVDHHFFWMLSTSITRSNDFNERIWYDMIHLKKQVPVHCTVCLLVLLNSSCLPQCNRKVYFSLIGIVTRPEQSAKFGCVVKTDKTAPSTSGRGLGKKVPREETWWEQRDFSTRMFSTTKLEQFEVLIKSRSSSFAEKTALQILGEEQGRDMVRVEQRYFCSLFTTTKLEHTEVQIKPERLVFFY